MTHNNWQRAIMNNFSSGALINLTNDDQMMLILESLLYVKFGYLTWSVVAVSCRLVRRLLVDCFVSAASLAMVSLTLISSLMTWACFSFQKATSSRDLYKHTHISYCLIQSHWQKCIHIRNEIILYISRQTDKANVSIIPKKSYSSITQWQTNASISLRVNWANFLH